MFKLGIGLVVLFLSMSSVVNAAPAIQLLLPGSVQRLPVDPKLKQGRTPFQDLQTRFDSARGVSVREIKGWYAGRCYFSDSPTKPIASTLVVEAKADSKAHGPAFADSPEYRRIVPLVSPLAAPEYFDSINAEKS